MDQQDKLKECLPLAGAYHLQATVLPLLAMDHLPQDMDLLLLAMVPPLLDTDTLLLKWLPLLNRS